MLLWLFRTSHPTASFRKAIKKVAVIERRLSGESGGEDGVVHKQFLDDNNVSPAV
jgi:hypothetical protein